MASACMVDPRSPGSTLSPVHPTDDPVLGMLVVPGLPPRLLPRACPHGGCDLAVYGRLDADDRLVCRHKGYVWSARTGAQLSAGNTGAGGSLALTPPSMPE